MSSPFPVAAALDASSSLDSDATSQADRVPNTSMLPGTEGVAPSNPCRDEDARRHMQAHAMLDRMCVMRDDGVDTVRNKVRNSPLASLATAAFVGAVIARIFHR